VPAYHGGAAAYETQKVTSSASYCRRSVRFALQQLDYGGVYLVASVLLSKLQGGEA